MLWLGFTLMNVSSCGCLLIVPIISAQNSKSGMTCQQWPLPHKTCYRYSKVVNCLGTISQLLPPLFHTRYIYFIVSLSKQPQFLFTSSLLSCKPIQKHLQSISSFIFVLGKANVKRAQSCIGGRQNLMEYLFYLQLLVGFNTLTYRKRLQLIPYTCGLSQHHHMLSIQICCKLLMMLLLL